MEFAYSETAILDAAEEEFIEKGFANSKTFMIAKRAGVAHAMLHYHYRTKENLFEIFFKKKVGMMADLFLLSFDRDLPFLERLKNGIEDHFDFIAENPKLPHFIFSEVLDSEEHKNRFLAIVKPQMATILRSFDMSLKEAVEEGTIRYMDAFDVIFTILSVNVFSFISAPVVIDIMDMNEEHYQQFLQHRKATNVAFILDQLKRRID